MLRRFLKKLAWNDLQRKALVGCKLKFSLILPSYAQSKCFIALGIRNAVKPFVFLCLCSLKLGNENSSMEQI